MWLLKLIKCYETSGWKKKVVASMNTKLNLLEGFNKVEQSWMRIQQLQKTEKKCKNIEGFCAQIISQISLQSSS